jgi:hypothetical protein
MDQGQRKTRREQRKYDVTLYSKANLARQPAVILGSLLDKSSAHL